MRMRRCAVAAKRGVVRVARSKARFRPKILRVGARAVRDGARFRPKCRTLARHVDGADVNEPQLERLILVRRALVEHKVRRVRDCPAMVGERAIEADRPQWEINALVVEMRISSEQVRSIEWIVLA